MTDRAKRRTRRYCIVEKAENDLARRIMAAYPGIEGANAVRRDPRIIRYRGQLGRLWHNLTPVQQAATPRPDAGLE